MRKRKPRREGWIEGRIRNIDSWLPGQGRAGGARVVSTVSSLLGWAARNLLRDGQAALRMEGQGEGGPGEAEVNVASFCLWSEGSARRNVEFSQHREK